MVWFLYREVLHQFWGGGGGENGYKEGLEHGRLTYSADDGLRYEGGLKDGKYNETFTSSDGLRCESRV